VTGGALNLSNGNNVISTITIDYIGLGGVDLTVGGATGIFFGTKESHSTFNKAFLLELVLARNEYDELRSLDADAIVVDPLFAPAALVPNLGPNATLLAASRGGTDEPHTWDINAGVLVWNLRHPRAQEVSAAWSTVRAPASRARPAPML
jgi:hypothetical protein